MKTLPECEYYPDVPIALTIGMVTGTLAKHKMLKEAQEFMDATYSYADGGKVLLSDQECLALAEKVVTLIPKQIRS